ncbi:Pentatricopeptide repeat-containing protein [Vigna angularis]|uniref:Pentatricopeptide repeat-containing protein n=1 Tax=Phaseolus angularis TaxID=3914 RepID=A0A8T0KHS2_PHAAN|nr:Pentatricopeptide repeat-containing protein [Vigna angularis]
MTMLPNNVVSSVQKCSSMISKCVSARRVKLAKSVHGHLIKTALFFDAFLANGLIDAYSKCGSEESLQKAFDDLPNKNTRSWNTLISFYSKTGLFHKARNLFDKMPQRNVVSYNSLISGFKRYNLHEDSVKLFQMMQNGRNVLVLDEFTLVSVVGSCACLGNAKWLRQAHGVAVIVGIDWNLILNNALIDAYGKCGEPDLSYSVFCWMRERNVVSWTSMVVAYSRACRLDEAYYDDDFYFS